MSRKTIAPFCALALSLAAAAPAVGLDGTAAAPPGPRVLEIPVRGVQREALVYGPSRGGAGRGPMVFAFHGHGGSAASMAAALPVYRYWPEAVVIYPQGLATPSRLDPAGVRSGWQSGVGVLGDRDLAFFDALVESLAAGGLGDPGGARIVGHSNGGVFAFVLWAERPGIVASVAVSAAAAPELLGRLEPKPYFAVAGKTDEVAPFAAQERMFRDILSIDGCETRGTLRDDGSRFFASASGTPAAAFAHSGGHGLPPEALPALVAFLKGYPAPPTPGLQPDQGALPELAP